MIKHKIGVGHYLAAEIWMERYRRHSGDGMTYTACLMALCFVEWWIGRNLPVPPAKMAKQLEDMLFGALEFLHGSLTGVRDVRVLFVRAVDMVRDFVENMDRDLLPKFRSFVGAALNVRRNCAFCSNVLADVNEVVSKDISADDFGGHPISCTKCTELTYCDLGCMQADKLRHRTCCVTHGASFFDDQVARVLNTS